MNKIVAGLLLALALAAPIVTLVMTSLNQHKGFATTTGPIAITSNVSATGLTDGVAYTLYGSSIFSIAAAISTGLKVGGLYDAAGFVSTELGGPFAMFTSGAQGSMILLAISELVTLHPLDGDAYRFSVGLWITVLVSGLLTIVVKVIDKILVGEAGAAAAAAAIEDARRAQVTANTFLLRANRSEVAAAQFSAAVRGGPANSAPLLSQTAVDEATQAAHDAESHMIAANRCIVTTRRNAVINPCDATITAVQSARQTASDAGAAVLAANASVVAANLCNNFAAMLVANAANDAQVNQITAAVDAATVAHRRAIDAQASTDRAAVQVNEPY